MNLSLSSLELLKDHRKQLSIEEIISSLYFWLGIFFIGISLVSSALSLAVLCQIRMIRYSNINIILASIAINDVIFVFVSAIRDILRYGYQLDIRKYSMILCRWHKFIKYTTINCSIWLLILVTVYRCISIFFYTKFSRICTNVVCISSIIVLVVVAAVVNIPQLIVVGYYTSHNRLSIDGGKATAPIPSTALTTLTSSLKSYEHYIYLPHHIMYPRSETMISIESLNKIPWNIFPDQSFTNKLSDTNSLLPANNLNTVTSTIESKFICKIHKERFPKYATYDRNVHFYVVLTYNTIIPFTILVISNVIIVYHMCIMAARTNKRKTKNTKKMLSSFLNETSKIFKRQLLLTDSTPIIPMVNANGCGGSLSINENGSQNGSFLKDPSMVLLKSEGKSKESNKNSWKSASLYYTRSTSLCVPSKRRRRTINTITDQSESDLQQSLPKSNSVFTESSSNATFKRTSANGCLGENYGNHCEKKNNQESGITNNKTIIKNELANGKGSTNPNLKVDNTIIPSKINRKTSSLRDSIKLKNLNRQKRNLKSLPRLKSKRTINGRSLAGRRKSSSFIHMSKEANVSIILITLTLEFLLLNGPIHLDNAFKLSKNSILARFIIEECEYLNHSTFLIVCLSGSQFRSYLFQLFSRQ
ncbi:hypothetical protein SNEBB_002536 [Seison nebaliae]|nr:hypothetical protein SNEBB_002536 [Seison nebaliae]